MKRRMLNTRDGPTPPPAKVPSVWEPKIAITVSINLSVKDSSVIGVVVMVLSAATGMDVNTGRRQSKVYHKRTKV